MLYSGGDPCTFSADVFPPPLPHVLLPVVFWVGMQEAHTGGGGGSEGGIVALSCVSCMRACLSLSLSVCLWLQCQLGRRIEQLAAVAEAYTRVLCLVRVCVCPVVV